MEGKKPLPLLALNHVSRVCSDLEASFRFYSEVLGFTPVKRPTSFNFEGAWLFNYGIGLHLIKGCPPARSSVINPKSCHISFQAVSLEEVEGSLVRLGIPYARNVFLEDGVQVAQLFFHDPDNNMIEVCNCDQLPVVPLPTDCTACVPRPMPVSVATAAAASFMAAGDLPSSASMDSASSDDGSMLGEPVHAAGACEKVSAAAAMSTGGSGDSFISDSAMSGLTAGGHDGSAMGIAIAELDAWPSIPCAPSPCSQN